MIKQLLVALLAVMAFTGCDLEETQKGKADPRAELYGAKSDRVFVPFKGKRCYICSLEAQAVDHIMPISKGGADTVSNKAPICQSCNSSKGNRHQPGQTGWRAWFMSRKPSRGKGRIATLTNAVHYLRYLRTKGWSL